MSLWNEIVEALRRRLAPAPVKAPFRITQRHLEAMGRDKRRTNTAEPKTLVEYTIPSFPPGVAPADAKMAMDDANLPIQANLGWAASALQGLFADGLCFLGYAYLSELAQRPEYRRPCERLSTEMTRKWIEFDTDSDEESDEFTGSKEADQLKQQLEAKVKAKKVREIVAEMERLGVRTAFQEAGLQDGLFGRSHIYLDTGNTEEPDELTTDIGDGLSKLSKSKIRKGSLKAVRPVEAVWTYPQGYNSSDPLNDNWYKPMTWMVNGKNVHRSRLLTFIGREVPDIVKPAYAFGGISLTQMLKPYVDNWLKTRQSVSDIVSAFSVFVLMTDLESLLTGGGADLDLRIQLFNLCRDNRGVMAINKNTEDFKNVAVSLSTLDMLQAQSQEHMSAVTGLPLVIAFGIQPMGLNASSDGELKVFSDYVNAYQEHFFRPNLDVVVRMVQLSLFGEVDSSIKYHFVPLEEEDAKADADVEKTQADADAVYVDMGALDPYDVRKQLSKAPNGRYRMIDPADLPEVPVEETGEPFNARKTVAEPGEVNEEQPPGNVSPMRPAA